MKVADQYISVKISETGAEVSVKSTIFVVRDENGSTLAQGMAVVERNAWSCETTIVMSPEMVIAVFGDPTMQHLYEKYDKQAGTEYGDDVLDQSEIVDAKETGFAAFKNAVQEYHVLGEIVKPSIKSIIEEAINEVDESSED
jgi:hypothetical protein